MKKHFSLYVLILSLLAVVACDPCTDCGPLEAEPFFRLKFINQDSLEAIQTELDKIEALLENTEETDSLDSVKNVLTSVQSVIENGNLQVTSISFLNTGLQETFEDSATSYTAPLSFTENRNTYSIEIENEVYELVIQQQLFDSVGVDRKVRRLSTQLEVNDHTFQLVETECTDEESECLSSQTLITCYF